MKYIYKLRNRAVTSTCFVSILLILYGIGTGQTLDKEGKVDACIDCHVGVAGNDYVFTGSIK